LKTILLISLAIILFALSPQGDRLWRSHGRAFFSSSSTSLSLPHLHPRLVTIALENFEYPWDVQINTLLLLCVANVLQVKIKQLFKNITQRSALRQNSYEWRGLWDCMGR